MNTARNRDEAAILKGLRAVRRGHGANCSSVGSVVDMLFASAAVGGALFAAVAAALASEPIEARTRDVDERSRDETPQREDA